MKKFTFLLLIMVSCFVYAQNELPVATKGLIVQHNFDKKGKKYLEVQIIDVTYSDSTDASCKANYTIQLKAVGKNIRLGNTYDYPPSGLHKELGAYSYSFDLKGIEKLSDGDSLKFETQIEMDDEKRNLCHKENYLLYDETKLLIFPTNYNPTEYREKLLAAQKTREEERKRRIAEEEQAAQRERSRCDTLLTIPYLANWVGASFFTKDNIERDLNVDPVGYSGGLVLYNFPKCGVSMEFSGAEEVCTELSFRLYGEEGMQMKKDLLEYGYTLVEKKKDLIAENNFRDMQYGTHSVYKCKLKNGGYSVCELLEGQAFMFTFYRSAR